MTYRYAERAARRGERWFLLGAAPGVAAEAAGVLRQLYPGLEVAGAFSGSPAPACDDEICRVIEAALPIHMLLVAYGAPAQDLWIARNQPRLQIPIAMGVGGTFNFIAGRSPRPPRIVKRLQLICLYRLITEPWRWRRQLALLRFAALVLHTWWQRRNSDHATGTRSM
jgi:N-acetylglucosaminyldiphosphoundecaprenol N-acetyl-beta-D-mannosaminyltransferase